MDAASLLLSDIPLHHVVFVFPSHFTSAEFCLLSLLTTNPLFFCWSCFDANFVSAGDPVEPRGGAVAGGLCGRVPRQLGGCGFGPARFMCGASLYSQAPLCASGLFRCRLGRFSILVRYCGSAGRSGSSGSAFLPCLHSAPPPTYLLLVVRGWTSATDLSKDSKVLVLVRHLYQKRFPK